MSSSRKPAAIPVRTRTAQGTQAAAACCRNMPTVIKRTAGSIEDVGLSAVFCRRRSRQVIYREGAGLSKRTTSTSSASRPTANDMAPREFESGRYFTEEEEDAWRARGRAGLRRCPCALSRTADGGGQYVHDGWRGIHRDRRFRQGQGRFLRSERAGYADRHAAEDRRGRAIRRSTAS